ncbi:MAG: DUF3093 domain-containing protein [Pseudonocardiaceae bacterium]
MRDRHTPGRGPSGREPVFDERLSVPLWWWPLGFGVAILLAAEVHMGYPGVRAWLPYLLTAPLTIAVLVLMGRHHVTVRGGELWVGRAHIPTHHLGQIQLIHPNAKRHALGPKLDPRAYVLHAGWVGPVLQITVIDPADSTPYWIFSVRRAEELAALLSGHTDGMPHEDSDPRSPSR